MSCRIPSAVVLFQLETLWSTIHKKGGNLELKEVPCGEWGVGWLLTPTPLFPRKMQVRAGNGEWLEQEQAAEMEVLFNLLSWLFHAAAFTHDKWARGKEMGDKSWV